MRPAAYAVLTLAALLVSVIAYLVGALLVWLCHAAMLVHPTPARSNCVIYALAKWKRCGGAIYLRPCRELRVFGCEIPHLAWVGKLGSDAQVEQYTTDEPLPLAGLSGVWFAGVVESHEVDPPVFRENLGKIP